MDGPRSLAIHGDEESKGPRFQVDWLALGSRGRGDLGIKVCSRPGKPGNQGFEDSLVYNGTGLAGKLGPLVPWSPGEQGSLLSRRDGIHGGQATPCPQVAREQRDLSCRASKAGKVSWFIRKLENWRPRAPWFQGALISRGPAIKPGGWPRRMAGPGTERGHRTRRPMGRAIPDDRARWQPCRPVRDCDKGGGLRGSKRRRPDGASAGAPERERGRGGGAVPRKRQAPRKNLLTIALHQCSINVTMILSVRDSPGNSFRGRKMQVVRFAGIVIVECGARDLRCVGCRGDSRNLDGPRLSPHAPY